MECVRKQSVFSKRSDSFRITVLGAKGVGKSSIVSRFVYDRFNYKRKPTVQEIHPVSCGIENKTYFDIVDTSGSEHFIKLRKMAISSSDAFILVFAVNDEQSFKELQCFRDEIRECKGKINYPLVVVGNKSDINEGHNRLQNATRECICCIDWEHKYFEVSAKDNINIFTVFQEIADQIKIHYPSHQKLDRRRKCPSQLERKDLHRSNDSTRLQNIPSFNSCQISSISIHFMKYFRNLK